MRDRSSDDASHVTLAEDWHNAVLAGDDGPRPANPVDSKELLDRIAAELDGAARSADGGLDHVRALGRDMALAAFGGDDALGATMTLLGRYFTDVVPVPDERRGELLGAFEQGYATAFEDAATEPDEDAATEPDESGAVEFGDADPASPAPDAAEPDSPAPDAAGSGADGWQRAALEQAGIGLARADRSGRFGRVDAAFPALVGYPANTFAESVTVAELIDPDDAGPARDRYAALLAGQVDAVRVRRSFPRPDGRTARTDLTVRVGEESDEPLLCVAVSADRDASTDELTGLTSRTGFFEAADDALTDERARVGLLLVGLDRFHAVNDRYGHVLGDELLVRVGERVRSRAEPTDLVARLAGDEFAILVVDLADEDELAELAAEVLDAFVEPFELAGRRVRVTASVGVMERDENCATGEDLLWAADTGMRWAKRAGGARFAAFDPERSRAENSRAELAAAIPEALERNQFVVFYQPIVRLTDRAIVAVEALVRWQHPRLGLLPPAKFLDPGVDVLHMAELDAWVLDRACRDQRRWYDEQPQHAPMVSVNVAASDVLDPGWADRVCGILTESGVRPDRLQLELTEAAFADLTDQLMSSLNRLADLGVHIAVDDFGSGVSNLPALAELPLHTIKLAGPLIDQIGLPEPGSRRDLTIIEAVVRLAHMLGSAVTAEGVETPAQARQLHGLGCDTAQGWYFQQPKPPEVIGELLRRSASVYASSRS